MSPPSPLAVLVTGASSGIGQATARLFLQHGHQVALVARRKEKLLALPGVAIAADLAQATERQRAVDEAVDALGRLDVLVNSAGIIRTGSLAATSLDAWNDMLNINLTAVFDMMRLCQPHLEKSRGAIVNLSSITGLRAFPGLLSYCVAKAGVDQLTRCAALDLAPLGIRVNGVNPGVVVSELHKSGGMDETAYAAFLERSKTTHPLGRVGTVDEVAEAVYFLASSASSWTTGVTLSVDGGRALTCAR